jgi:hypothetical protein
MSKRAKIASLILIAFLAIALLAVVASLAFGRDPLVVFSKEVGLLLGILIVPAVLATLFVLILQRLAIRQIDKR